MMKKNKKKYHFYGLDKKGNILSGVIVFGLITLFFIISWIIVKDKINIDSLLFSIFFITSNAFLAVSFYLLVIAKKLHKKWEVIFSPEITEIYYNSHLVIKEKYFDEIKYIKLKKTRYLIFTHKNNKISVQVQQYLFSKTSDLKDFDSFWEDYKQLLNQKYEFKDISSNQHKISYQYIKK